MALRLLFTKPKLFVSAIMQYLQMRKVRQLKSAEIAFVAVSPGCQHGGIGESLIRYAVRYCREKGCRCLNTKTSNRRLARFYQESFNARELATFNVFDRKYSILEWEI